MVGVMKRQAEVLSVMGEVYVKGLARIRFRRGVTTGITAAAMLWSGALAAQTPAAQGSATQNSAAQSPTVQTPAAVQPAGMVQAAGAVQAPAAALTAAVQGGTITGRVVAGTIGKAGGVPLPGVAITAMNSLTGRKYATTTDIDGKYEMTIPRNGRYVVRADLTGFAEASQEVVLNGVQAEAAKQGITIVPGATDFGMQLASRAAAAEAKQTGAGAGLGVQSGMQGLSLSAGEDVTDATTGARNAGAALPTLGGLGDDAADSVTVNGEAGSTNGLANFSED
jgi:hypothetical protein